MYQVYLVESDRQLNHLFLLYLQKEGWEITSFLDGEKALKYIDRTPHIWILDSNLKDIEGYQILNEVKEKYPHIPVILISDRNSNMDRIIGLEMGCDDYLPKPFLPKELVIRTRNLLERTYEGLAQMQNSRTYNISGYIIDEIQRIVLYNSTFINLTSKEFDLLIMLVKNPMRAFSRDQIRKYVWQDELSGSDRSVDDLIRRLRKKLPELRIESIYGFGYRLINSDRYSH